MDCCAGAGWQEPVYGCSVLPQPSYESGGISLGVMVPHTHGAPALKLTLHQLSLRSRGDMLTASSPMARGHSQPGVRCFLCHIRGLCVRKGIACGNPCIHTFSPSMGFPKHQTYNVSHLDLLKNLDAFLGVSQDFGGW